MSCVKKELRQLRSKRRHMTFWTFAFSFLLLALTSGRPFMAFIFSILFATIARVGVTIEIEEYEKDHSPGGGDETVHGRDRETHGRP
jgi:hypothetical protein